MINAAKTLIEQFSEPSPRNEETAIWLTIGLAHMLAGMIVAYLASYIIGFLAVVFIPLVYFLLKEVPDTTRGGSWRDSIEDTGFVTAGCIAGVFGLLVGAGLFGLAVFLALERVQRTGY